MAIEVDQYIIDDCLYYHIYKPRSKVQQPETACCPRTYQKSFADRAFSVTGPKIWNSLPQNIRNITDFTMFKPNLKTYLFNEFF